MASPQEPGPVATPLPPAPSFAFIDQAQRDVLFALFDAVVPSIASASHAARTKDGSTVAVADDEFERALDAAVGADAESRSRESLAAFLRHRPSQDPNFQKRCLSILAISPQRMQLVKVLELMRSHLGSLLFTGHWTPIDRQPARVREKILQSWAASRLVAFRVLAKTIVTLAQNADAQTSPLFGSLSGYTDAPANWKAGGGYDYKFLQAPPGPCTDDAHVIDTDVVIVGSGCGAGVAAKNLAEAGHRVLVVEKGYYFPPSQLPMAQEAAMDHLFDQSGVYMTENGSAGIVCGGAWGGGGTINWSVCLKLQDFVREEWADGGALPFFTSRQFDECCDRVLDFAGASTSGIRHNHRNRVLLDGAAKLGWRAQEAPQNTAGKEHYCGRCHLGCGSAEKRGPAQAWLPAAADAGADFMEGMKVTRVLFGEDGKTATGVEGLWTSRDAEGGVHTPVSERTQRRVVINAKRVVLSAGTLWSPLLLTRSGVENDHLGQNLHIHPCNFLSGTYDEATQPWEGGIITSYSPEFENLDEQGHGVKLEPTCMVPYAALAMRPWTSGLDSKLQMINFSHSASFISLTRDKGSGRVFADEKTGGPRIDYSTSEHDAEHTLEGVVALAKICYVTGAREIRAHLWNVEPFRVDRAKASAAAAGVMASHGTKAAADPEFSDPAFKDWLTRLRRAGNKPPVAIWISAHQMGTCRMSASRDRGVVDGQGKVWGKEGLYVADGSVFPSASGVNPMVTIMTLSDWISRGVDASLRG